MAELTSPTSASDAEAARYRDYYSILGIAPEELLNETRTRELVLKAIGGFAFRYDYNLILKRLFAARGITPRGVVHLGGHRGEELLVYLALGFQQILLVEPDPSCYSDLRDVTALVERTMQKAGRFLEKEFTTRLATVNAAASDQDGTATLFRTAFSPANSMFKPESEKDWMRVTDSIEVDTRTVDRIVAELGPDWSECGFNFMRLNIQGAEMLALRGASKTLENMDLLYVEVNFDERYPGAPSAKEIESWLATRGFTAVERYKHDRDFDNVGDILFVKG
jgi:FkbM family methyltransferase